MWTPRLVVILETMDDLGKSPEDIAKSVNKSVRSVNRKLKELGREKSRGVKAKLTDEQELDAYIKVKVNRRWSEDEACSRLGVSISTLKRAFKNVLNRYENDRKRILDIASERSSKRLS